MCVVYDYTTNFVTHIYDYSFKDKKMKKIDTKKYKRESKCTPLKLRLSSTFIGVHCDVGSSNFERIYLYDQALEYTIYEFDLYGENTDFNLHSYNDENIQLAVSGSEPTLYTIQKEIYLDSTTRELKDLEGIEIIF